MHAQKKVLNPQVFLEFSCYVTFAVLVYHLASSGNYQSYVTPKMVPYLYFTAAVMVIWSGMALSRLFRPQHKTRVAHCFVLAIPIMFLLLPHAPVSASDLSSGYFRRNAWVGLPGNNSYNSSTDNRGLQTLSDSLTSLTKLTPSENPPIDNSNIENSNLTTSQSASSTAEWSADSSNSAVQSDLVTPEQEENALSLPGLDTKNKKIIVQDEHFSFWFTELYTTMEKYEGYQITIKGFVFRDHTTMKDNEFVPARLAMSCCVADLMPCGIIFQYDKASQLTADAWVTVEGIIHIEKYMDNNEPEITVTGISPAEKPKAEYIYPF